MERFAFPADQVTIRVEEWLRAYALVLRGGAALFDPSESVSREEWRSYTDKLHAPETVAGIQGIGFAALIPRAQLDHHIAMVRAAGFPDYTVSPAGERELYSAIVYLEPFRDRNLRAFGYDKFAEPVRRAAMIQARDSGRAVLSGKVALVQETGSDLQSVCAGLPPRGLLPPLAFLPLIEDHPLAVELAQGFGIARPMPAAQIPEWV